MTDHDSQFLDAACAAECARDCLIYAQRDAIKLANEAMELPAIVLLDPDPSGRAFALAAQAIRLERKISMMVERIDQMLGPVVAAERAMLNKTFS